MTEVLGSATKQECPSGGVQVAEGTDQDGDGRLQTAEIGRTFTVCSGSGQAALAPSVAGKGLLFDAPTQSLSVDQTQVESWARDAAIDTPDEVKTALDAVAPGLGCAPGDVLQFDVTTGGFTCGARSSFSGSWSDLADKPALFSGKYADLSGTPDLSVFATNDSLAPIARSGSWSDLQNKPALFSGNYADLAGKPDLSVYATASSLASVATSGKYADLSGAPDLSIYAKSASLSPVASSGSYADLSGTPDLSVYAKSASLSPVASSGSYTDLAGAPDLSVYEPKDQTPWVGSNDGGYTYARISGDRAENADIKLDLWAFMDGTDLWQVITGPRTADLSRIVFWLYFDSPNALTVSLIDGEGTSGAVLYSTTLDGTAGAKTVDFSNSGVKLVEGHLYTFRVQSPTGVRLELSRYSGGYVNGDSAWDLRFELYTSTGHPVVVTADGNVGVNTNSPTAPLDVSGSSIRIRNPSTPASSSDACSQGQIAWDQSYVYVCVADSTWRRSALQSW